MRTAVAVLGAIAAATSAFAQTESGCLRLLGSSACPAFQYAYLSPGNLTAAFPLFGTVTDVASFDAAAFTYFSNPYQYQTTKFIQELGCSNASSAVIRWERTVLCSMWVNEHWSAECLAYYNGTTVANSQKMVCQSTCIEYSNSEYAVVNNTDYCPGPDLTGGLRDAQLTKDYVDCTNWTTLATNDSATCVAGADNEGYCGFGSSTAQLCDFCDSSSPDDCCYDSTTDVSALCGYALANRTVTSTSSSASSASTTALQNAVSHSSALTGGKLAGAIVGAVLGGLLLLGLLLLGLVCLRRRRRNRRASGEALAAAQAYNPSEKGLIGQQPLAGASSPTMGGTTAAFSLASGAGKSPVVDASALGARTGGVVLPRVRDENAAGERWIETGADVAVLWPYTAALPDELSLRPGMRLRVLRLYDDAWGTAQVVAGEPDELGKTGAFPIVCVSEGPTYAGSPTASSRDSH
ncbi:hypothetical protein Q5752_002049 [Cryptotrichosporon argae]